MLEWYVSLALVALYLGALIWKKAPEASQKASGDDKNYSVFCRGFDVEVHATKLDEVLGAEDSSAREARYGEFEKGFAGWRVRTDFAALETASRIRATVTTDILKDTIIALLIDHSGSMRGQKILLTVGAVTVASDVLAGLAVPLEVLGFTTVRWKGGLSREKWLRAGRPPNPGRLNDVLHIIYRRAGETGIGFYNPMLRPDLLKENIDGEALEWAASRLRERPESRKHIIVLSDDTPVDDSTLSVNRADYLDSHLRTVIQDITQAGDIQLSAIGINHDVSHYYPRSTRINTPDDLGGAILDLIEALVSVKPYAPRMQEA
jgi:cobaltochelatase CobT